MMENPLVIEWETHPWKGPFPAILDYWSVFGTPVPQVELCRYCLWRPVFHKDAEMFFAADPSPAQSEITFSDVFQNLSILGHRNFMWNLKND